jgi:hypothetical protein
MTKACTHGRDRKVAMRQLEESLKRLRTDRLDLWQIHEDVYENDPDRPTEQPPRRAHRCRTYRNPLRQGALQERVLPNYRPCVRSVSNTLVTETAVTSASSDARESQREARL